MERLIMEKQDKQDVIHGEMIHREVFLQSPTCTNLQGAWVTIKNI